jgi:hypothetical protein
MAERVKGMVLAVAVRAAVAFVVGNAVVTGCDYSDYPIEASFCDDWCRTLRRTPCDQEPENCIRDCESSLPSARCFELQVTLLDCYRETPPEALVCVEEGFQGQVRPRPEICTLERDALIACEAPRVKSCIDACRELDADDPVVAASVAGAEQCPESPMPCEQLCWQIDARAESGIFGADDPSEMDLAALGAPLIACAREGARVCQTEVAASIGDAVTRMTWTSLFLDCAGLPSSFDLFD